VTNGLRGRKRSLYEGGIRVPGIVEWPRKIKSGTVINVPCFTSDYFPTIAQILGIDIDKYKRSYDGQDLQPYWSEQKDKRDKPLAFQFKKNYALIDNEFKFMGGAKENSRLYNLVTDPSEQVDVSTQYPEKFKSLSNFYQKWHYSVQKSNLGSEY
jgi:arylsulfatase A-like enzyme